MNYTASSSNLLIELDIGRAYIYLNRQIEVFTKYIHSTHGIVVVQDSSKARFNCSDAQYQLKERSLAKQKLRSYFNFS